MSKNLTVIQTLCPTSKYYLKCGHEMIPEGIVIHNTANDASAENEINYMLSNNYYTSFHYAVDDKQAVQGILLTRNSWNAGDGVNGAGNRKHIAIEICYSKSGGYRYFAAEDNAAYLTSELLKQYNWGIDKVKKHQDFSGKFCPHRILSTTNGWANFLAKVTYYLNYKEPTATIDTSAYTWKVQCGAFKTQEQAQSYAKTLNSKGIATYVYEEK